jgi:arsenate reductase
MFNILILCTGNSARSILAEAIFNRDGAEWVKAYSAGSNPAGLVNPAALRLLAAKGLPTRGYRSKSWYEFTAPGAPRMDLVITVCNSAAGEVCPVWPGAPLRCHWGMDDPSWRCLSRPWTATACKPGSTASARDSRSSHRCKPKQWHPGRLPGFSIAKTRTI